MIPPLQNNIQGVSIALLGWDSILECCIYKETLDWWDLKLKSTDVRCISRVAIRLLVQTTVFDSIMLLHYGGFRNFVDSRFYSCTLAVFDRLFWISTFNNDQTTVGSYLSLVHVHGFPSHGSPLLKSTTYINM